MNTSTSYPPGTKLQYTCEQGYEKGTTSELTCEVDGTWSGGQAVCMLIGGLQPLYSTICGS